MTRRQLLVVEGLIILVAGVVLYAIIGWPFGGGEDAKAGGGTVQASPAPSQASGAASSTASASASAAPAGDDCAPQVDESFLSANQIVSYYGSPYAETLGILGQYEPDEVVRRLKEHATALDELNGIRGVQAALHMVYATAQPRPGENGLYLLYVDPQTTQEYIDLACREGLFLFLDLQIGRSDVATEVTKVLPYLQNSQVQIALDPEFTMHGDEVPGEVIGRLDADEINEAQRLINDYVEQNGLSDRVLVVHQFDEPMIVGKERIERFPNVRLVIDMDGFGPKETKLRKFGIYAQPAEYSGIKIFFKQDTPPLTDEEVETLDPDLIIYQ